jgi:hypothetical protein
LSDCWLYLLRKLRRAARYFSIAVTPPVSIFTNFTILFQFNTPQGGKQGKVPRLPRFSHYSQSIEHSQPFEHDIIIGNRFKGFAA